MYVENDCAKETVRQHIDDVFSATLLALRFYGNKEDRCNKAYGAEIASKFFVTKICLHLILPITVREKNAESKRTKKLFYWILQNETSHCCTNL